MGAVTSAALAQWKTVPRTTRGGQAQYSDRAIETMLSLGGAFKLRLRQAEGMTGCRRSTVRSPAGAGASCIWPLMPTVA